MMDQTERLAADVQELKNRFDGMSLRFAISEEREKRVDDKIDRMAELLTLKLEAVETSMRSWSNTVRWGMFGIVGVVLAGVGRWLISGALV